MKRTLIALSLLPAGALAQGPLDKMPFHDLVTAASPPAIRQEVKELAEQIQEDGVEVVLSDLSAAVKDRIDASSLGKGISAGAAAELMGSRFDGAKRAFDAMNNLELPATAGKPEFNLK